MKHRYYVCGCGKPTCQYCDGGVLRCLVCGGYEGELLLECPGRALTYDEHYANYQSNMRRIAETVPSVLPKPLDTVSIEQ